MQIKNQITAIVMIIIMCVMMIHNAIPHVHHNHEQIAEDIHEHSHHSHDDGDHHSHSESKKKLTKKSETNNSIFDLSDHEHTFHLHSFEDYLLSKSSKSEVEKQFALLPYNRIINENSELLSNGLGKHILRIFRFSESPPTYSFSLRGPPLLG
jgi:hypothetical protein